jgi:hypothetical protein
MDASAGSFESLSVLEIAPNRMALMRHTRDKLIALMRSFNNSTDWGMVNGSPGIAHELGARSASIQGLYDAMGRGDVTGFTVPAINIRGLSYDVARAVIRAAKKNNSGTFIFEIAKSEISYTGQTPDSMQVMIAAAVKKDTRTCSYRRPFQANARNISRPQGG